VFSMLARGGSVCLQSMFFFCGQMHFRSEACKKVNLDCGFDGRTVSRIVGWPLWTGTRLLPKHGGPVGGYQAARKK
jgi:hypothetical protein